ncbi:hypothetical protein AcdelDRAFT_0483 [Acidovorax delafieldii 2AN]|uniref:Uncharacterized protein n=1 Tax=Acidovorax delafieldii 2AN TaxID=573060 RepID=C5T0Q3_ACIDE|nr:hypothetical protein AcdelDRAFT_0483 [Acidovorax delafieldii 2AN]
MWPCCSPLLAPISPTPRTACTTQARWRRSWAARAKRQVQVQVQVQVPPRMCEALARMPRRLNHRPAPSQRPHKPLLPRLLGAAPISTVPAFSAASAPAPAPASTPMPLPPSAPRAAPMAHAPNPSAAAASAAGVPATPIPVPPSPSPAPGHRPSTGKTSKAADISPVQQLPAREPAKLQALAQERTLGPSTAAPARHSTAPAPNASRAEASPPRPAAP